MKDSSGSQSTDEKICLRQTALPGVISVEARSRRTYSRHTHDEFGIGVLLEGAHESVSGRGQVRAETGQVISVNPGEVHDGHPVDGEARRWRMLFFRPEALASAFAGLGASPGSEFAYPVLASPSAACAFLDLHTSVSGYSASAFVVESLLIEMLSHLVETDIGTQIPSPSSVAPAQKLLDAEPEVEASLDDLATLCGLSRFHFLRAFRSATGLPPHAYQVQRRLHMGRRMILDGCGLADAANASGFADQSHFSRHFVRTYGYTPGELVKARKTAGRVT
ncbi:helix-turn-helix transcriptional regulator [Roseibium sediminicola]|uniref:AraC family transcriptional regulator n=1 Tax=Roseibium sediminicola TaxID=2933272 RepID=A0ABT0GZW0_9HYPH|nr:AraC family transcriptional regulator [Roseibium sp. CAU 1639]MCK7614972.1 AraC family transcriptional regulator [Roseibium sp. CAU 1639]